MKKLMLAAMLALGTAGLSYGASFHWELNDDDTDLDTWAGNNVYVILASDWDPTTATFESTVANAFAQENNDLAPYATIEDGRAVGTGDQYFGYGEDANITENFMAIIVSDDESGYVAVAMDSVPGYDSKTSGIENYLISANDVVSAWDAAGEAYTPWAGGSEGVPEPTSGLLLLIGMAGLALRRRCA